MVFGECLASTWRFLSVFLKSSRGVLDEFFASPWRGFGKFLQVVHASSWRVLGKFLESSWKLLDEILACPWGVPLCTLYSVYGVTQRGKSVGTGLVQSSITLYRLEQLNIKWYS